MEVLDLARGVAQPRARAARASASTSPTCARATPARRWRRCRSASATSSSAPSSASRSPTPSRPSGRCPILDYRPVRGADYLDARRRDPAPPRHAGPARPPRRGQRRDRARRREPIAVPAAPDSPAGARSRDRALQRRLERPRPRRDHGHARPGHGLREPHRARVGARARRCAGTSARSSRPGPTSASRAGAPTPARASWSRSGPPRRPTRTG